MLMPDARLRKTQGLSTLGNCQTQVEQNEHYKLIMEHNQGELKQVGLN